MPSAFDEQIASLGQALGHPIRVAILRTLHEREEAGPVDVAQAIEVDLNVVGYHFRTLVRLGAVSESRTEVRRGAIAHIYVLSPDLQAKLPRLISALT